jgi:hypothetical protein
MPWTDGHVGRVEDDHLQIGPRRGRMAELNTKENKASVAAFVAAIPDAQRREDAVAVTAMMKAATGAEPRMWGTSIVGFGSQHYTYASGREGDWFRLGFSPRTDALTLYLSSGVEQYPELMARLGKYNAGKACLHIKRLADVDAAVLKQLLTQSLKAPLPGAK